MDKKHKLMLGSLLHDIGKVTYRYNDGRNHSLGGYEFIKNEVKLEDKDILDCILYHHKKDLDKASIDKDSLAYITYIADNIAAFSDRRDDEKEEFGFDKELPLESVFNILNGNKKEKKYEAKTLEESMGLNIPMDQPNLFSRDFYGEVLFGIKDNLMHLELNRQYINSYLQVIENYLSYVPSSTNKNELSDISLYDHMKLTSMYASSIYDYLEEFEVKDYRLELYDNSKSFYDKKVFLLVSLDMSGIQNFIYKVTKENALKNLRTRSFYLEMIMEVYLDEILEGLNLTRANVLYAGGGNAYLILANTEKTRSFLEDINNQLNNWLLDVYGIDLYLSQAYVEASANDLSNKTKGDLDSLYKDLGAKIANKKSRRYSYEDIVKLNSFDAPQNTRECRICYRLDKLNDDNLCSYCDNIVKVSSLIVDKEFYVLMENKHTSSAPYLDMPFQKKLFYMDKGELTSHIRNNNYYIRTYTKNKAYVGQDVVTRLWIGDYSYSNLISDLTSPESTIDRIGVLRADVDNLGKTIISGFEDQYKTLSRTSTLSRNLNMFFKSEINYILENPKYFLVNQKDKRKIIIIYSGGDDVFVVGGWEDVIGFSIDLKNRLRDYSLDSLTLSAGIGIYHKTYPLLNMAQEVGRLEDAAKDNCYIENNMEVKKNSICLFDPTLIFSWQEFEKNVLGEKFAIVSEYFDSNSEKGSSLIYKLVELIREINKGEDVNIARLVYLLARNEPKTNKENHNMFSEKMFRWIKNKKDRKELLAALYIYVYSRRGI
mgnify:CR=1 FL=1